MTRRPFAWAVAAVLALAGGAAGAEPESPPVDLPRLPPVATAAEQEYQAGVRARVARDWAGAVGGFRRAVELQPSFAEAWSELGFALRNQGRYAESLDAYDEALRLRPDFPEALEYLGEAYVKLGRLDDARRVLARLRPLDAGRAAELAEEIEKSR